MSKKFLSAVIASALICTLSAGCAANEVPPINSDNPALSITGSSDSSSSSSVSSPEQSSAPQSSLGASSGSETVSADLKAKMDSYEKAANEYADYAEKHGKTELSSAAYAEYLELYEKYHTLADHVGKIKKAELSAADAAYYDDVTKRVSERISKIDDKRPEPPASSVSKPDSGTASSSSTSKPDFPKPSVPSSTSTKKPISSVPQPSTTSPITSRPTPSTPDQSTIKPSSSSSSEAPKPSSSSSAQQPVVDKSSLLNDYTRKWAYNQLNSKQKEAYARLFASAQVTGESTDVSDLDLDKNDIDNVYWAFDYDNAQFLALGSGYGYSYKPSTGVVTAVKIKYGRSASEIAAIQSDFNSTAQKVIADAKKLGSEYEQLKYIHDWIVNNTSYQSSGPLYKSEADGAVVYGKALCEGYSKAFMYFAQSLGYECVCVAGYAGEEHMWNMVKLNGSWYHVDVTWDDPITPSGANSLRYDYFLISDSTIGKDHRVVNTFAIPSAPRDYN